MWFLILCLQSIACTCACAYHHILLGAPRPQILEGNALSVCMVCTGRLDTVPFCCAGVNPMITVEATVWMLMARLVLKMAQETSMAPQPQGH